MSGRIFDSIDRATFRVVDAAVLWLWNEVGIPWLMLARAGVLVLATLALADASQWGRAYDTSFWVLAAIDLPMFGVVSFIIGRLPPEVLGAINIATRTGALSRLLRYVNLSVALIDISDARNASVSVAALIMLLILSAAIPRGPRQRKRREIKALAFAPAS